MPEPRPSASVVSRSSQREHNRREKAAYHAYKAAHGAIRGGQKGFRAFVRNTPVAQRPLSLLGPHQAATRDTALAVLSRSRRFGRSLTHEASSAHTSVATVRRYLGEAGFRKEGRRWKATASDSLERAMVAFEDGSAVRASPRDSSEASKLGRYFRDLKALERGEAAAIQRWRGETWTDAAGRVHSFETDPSRLAAAVERREYSVSAYDPYVSGGESEASFTEE